MADPKEINRALIEELLHLSGEKLDETALNEFDFSDNAEDELDSEILEDLRASGF